MCVVADTFEANSSWVADVHAHLVQAPQDILDDEALRLIESTVVYQNILWEADVFLAHCDPHKARPSASTTWLRLAAAMSPKTTAGSSA